MQGKNGAYWLLLLPPLFWAGNFIAGRLVADSVPPMALSYWRWVLGMLLALPWVAGGMWRQRRVIAKHWGILLLLGTLGVASFNSLVYLGLQNTTATNALIINSTIPMFILLFNWALLKGGLDKRQLLGMLLSFLGVLALLVKGDWRSLSSLQINAGDPWIVLSSMVWAGYSLGLRFKPAALSGGSFLGVTLIIGVLVLSPLYWWWIPRTPFALSPLNIGALSYVAVFPSLLAYMAWNQGVKVLGAATAGQYIHLMPLFGAGLSLTILDEQLAWFHAQGAGLIALGLVMALYRSAR
ncbi:DMT family transporter [Aliagarivorans taiwanensis]|uniref:DMT family transporter n=1 Tax=Aliagarivorans taiwanensis TaxID=561966 RepID=UPI00047CB085|nr:DMT family transporter [Aliagarivorans taiwanensis]